MIDYQLTFPVATRERAQMRAVEAIGARGGVYPVRITLGAVDYRNLRRDMDTRHGYHRKTLEVFNIPIVEGDVERGMIGFEWE